MQSGWKNWKRVSAWSVVRQENEREDKGKVYRSVVRLALMYGAETWALKKAQEKKSEVAEIRMLQSVRSYEAGQDQKWRRKIGRPKRRLLDKVKDDIKEKGLSADDVYDRATWRRRPYVTVHRPQIKVGIR